MPLFEHPLSFSWLTPEAKSCLISPPADSRSPRFAALLSGVIQSLGTHWGLVRYYWVVTKFILTVGAIILLMLHQYKGVAEAARRVSISVAGTLPEIGPLRTELLIQAGFALLVLVVIIALSTYKPWGLTPYGRRQQQLQEREAAEKKSVPTFAILANSGDDTAGDSFPLGLKIFLTLAALVIALFAVLHHTGDLGTHHH